MPTNNYDIVSVIICDDVRQEGNGKEILIGVYNGTIVFKTLPSEIPKLVFRISVRLHKLDAKKFSIAVQHQSGKEIFSTTGDVLTFDDPYRIFGAVAGPLTFQEPANYKILFGIDAEPRPIGEFDVRGPKNEVEVARLK
jgi:hypothetical protein